MSAEDPSAAQGGAPGTPGTTGAGPEPGGDLVRIALGRARAAARAQGQGGGLRAGRMGGGRRRARDATRSGAGPDARDPQPVGGMIDRLVAERGWGRTVAVGSVIGRWPVVVGPDLAEHCTPETFEDGVLTVRADSTAWATQIKLLLPTVQRRLDEEIGKGTVEKIVVRGPGGPSWRRGPLVAPGSNGPRDTYG